jgi:hypothetical protein
MPWSTSNFYFGDLIGEGFLEKSNIHKTQTHKEGLV